jgi:hypothetical protein
MYQNRMTGVARAIGPARAAIEGEMAKRSCSAPEVFSDFKWECYD